MMKKNHFPHPQDFTASNFANNPAPLTFLAFGSGKHKCLGQQFALTLIKIATAYMLKKRSWKLAGAIPQPERFATLGAAWVKSPCVVLHTKI